MLNYCIIGEAFLMSSLEVTNMTSDGKVWFLRLFLFCGMVFCFSLQSLENFEKFIDGKASISESDIEKKAEPLPTFSICAEPPFNEDLLETTFNVSSKLFLFSSDLIDGLSTSNPFPLQLSPSFSSANSLNQLWKASVFKPDFFIVGSNCLLSDEPYFNSMCHNWTSLEFNIIHSLWYGRCTSFVLKEPKKANEALIMGFMFAGVKKPDQLVMILHENPGSRFSLIPGDYLSQGSKQEVLKLGQFKNIGINKEKKIMGIRKKNCKCREYRQNDSQAKCYLEKVLKPFFREESEAKEICTKMGQKFEKFCMIPQAFNILNQTLTPQCTKQEEYQCMKSLLITQMDKMRAKCPNPCTEIIFQTYTKSISHNLQDWAFVQMYFQSDHMTLLEEYLIFDFASILVAIGGSLGLFLGFSFFQCGSVILNKALDLVRKIMGRL